MNSKQEKLDSFARLLDIMDDLRANCPWDKKQTFESLRHLTIEETYELADAILEGNASEIKKELGDLFFSCINLSRKLGLDVESVIRDSNRKFEKRCKKMEKNMNKNKLDWNLKNLEKEWQKSK